MVGKPLNCHVVDELGPEIFFKIYLLDKELRKINIYPSRRYFNRLSAKCGNDNHGGEKEAQVQLIKVNPRSGSVHK